MQIMAKPIQFSLRTLLLAIVPVAVVSLPLGWYIRRPGPRPPPVPVSGTILLDGDLLIGARVEFYPTDPNGQIGAGLTEWNGTFELPTRKPSINHICGSWPIRPLAGVYKVTVITRLAGRALTIPGAPIAPEIPGRYANPETSGLIADVTYDGPNAFTFNLSSMPDE